MSLILLVDDHEPMRTTLADLLQHMGHGVITAGNGKQALAMQKQNPANILLTDIFMPEMDGFELIQEFRRLYPSVKIIALSGGMPKDPGGPYLNIAKQFGAKWILPKPFSITQLADVIRAASEEEPAA
jgi:CheY-like chemotaxis protein